MAKNIKKNDNNYAIAYYRYSSHSQNEKSIEQQQELAREYSESKGYKLVGEYSDAAISGTTSNRPQYQLMLSEIKKIKPSILIIWKTDRLGRNREELMIAKKKIRDAGCEIHYIAEPKIEDDAINVLMESVLEGLSEYYSLSLSTNIRRGMMYNAEHGLYNGNKILGYSVDENKKYIIDETAAPYIRTMFNDYAAGVSMKEICDNINSQGFRTARGNEFGPKTLNKILKNKSYIGEYHFGGVVNKGAIPPIVDEATFDKAQERLILNKRNKKSKLNEENKYSLTGKLICGECGSTMHGVSGYGKRNKDGNRKKYYYYYCKNRRCKKCDKTNERNTRVEELVSVILKGLLSDSENLASLAVDAAVYYKSAQEDSKVLEALEAQLKVVENGLANFVKAIEQGIIFPETQQRMAELNKRKSALTEAITAEKINQSLFEDEFSIKAYFEKYMHADLDNKATKYTILEYFVDKIYLYNDKIVITSWFSNNKISLPYDDLEGKDFLSSKSEEKSFVFCPFGSTK